MKISVCVENGNIIISGEKCQISFIADNIKYVFSQSYMQCDTYYLFYIADNDELYRFSIVFLEILNQSSKQVNFKKTDYLIFCYL